VAGGAFGFATLDANGLDDRAHMLNELSELVSLMNYDLHHLAREASK
jgi:hypothetical protein